jgi:hypothetical protein
VFILSTCPVSDVSWKQTLSLRSLAITKRSLVKVRAGEPEPSREDLGEKIP